MKFQNASEVEQVARNPGRKEYFRLWHIKHRERRRLDQIERRKANPEKYREMERVQRSKNPAPYRAAQKRWRSKHMEKSAAWLKTWLDKNPNKRILYNQRRRDSFNFLDEEKKKLVREHRRELSRRFRDNNPGYGAVQSQKYRALRDAKTVRLGCISWWMKKMRSRNFVICYYCQRLFHACDIHFDHMVPIARGGSHTIENLCVSCPHCNLSKNKKLISEWADKPQLILDL